MEWKDLAPWIAIAITLALSILVPFFTQIANNKHQRKMQKEKLEFEQSQRYCKRAAKQNLMAYSWKCFLYLYNDYRRPKLEVCDPNDKIRNKLKDFNFLLSCCPRGSIKYEVILRQKQEWLQSLKLEEDKILGDEN